jgi:hypothetical protein
MANKKYGSNNDLRGITNSKFLNILKTPLTECLFIPVWNNPVTGNLEQQ